MSRRLATRLVRAWLAVPLAAEPVITLGVDSVTVGVRGAAQRVDPKNLGDLLHVPSTQRSMPRGCRKLTAHRGLTH